MGVTDIVLVRHGESLGNVERETAEAQQSDRIPLRWRDADTPLSDLGRQQAGAAAAALAESAADRRPEQLWSSPYCRAADTAQAIGAALGLPVLFDERLRDRELGILDGLTSHGARRLFPDEAARRRSLGKLYYRPPGGESWADVALRLRTFFADVLPDGRGAAHRLALVTHDAVILCGRYVLERLPEPKLLDLAATCSVPNASLTRLVRSADGDWRADEFAAVAHLHERGVTATRHGSEQAPREEAPHER